MGTLTQRLLLGVVWLATRLGTKPLADTTRRSLWAGTPILNMAVNARAERLLGVDAESLVYNTYFITDQFTHNLSRWMRIPVWRRLVTYVVFVWACLRYHRFHYYCDRGLLPTTGWLEFNPNELAVLRELGKEVFFWTYGADVRTRRRTEALGEFHCCLECPNPGRSCVCNDDLWDRHYQVIRSQATAVFAMGDMLEYTPGSRNDLFFWPVDLAADEGRKYAPHYPNQVASGAMRVVHAPNHRHFKGTRYLIEAMDRLRAEGLEVELVLVERVPNDQALAIYRTADLIFDQCLIGFHGYFAIEAMAMGKPVMCYIRDPEHYLIDPEACPLISAHAQQVEAVLRQLVRDRPRLHRLGQQGRAYVERYYTLSAFANRLELAYQSMGVTP